MYRAYRNQAAAAYLSLYFLNFLSLQFSTLKFFATLFSGTVRLRRLKLDTHVDSGQMYRVYRNQAAAYSSLYFFIFFLSNFQTLKFSSHFYQELWGLEGCNVVHTWTVGGCIVCTRIRLCCLFLPLCFLSPIFNIKIFVTLFSGIVRHRRLKLSAHVDNGWMYRVYRNQVAAAYLSHLIFIFLSLQFPNIKMFLSLFSGNVRPRRLKLDAHMDNGWMNRVYRHFSPELRGIKNCNNTK